MAELSLSQIMEALSEFTRIRIMMLLASSQDDLSLADFMNSLKLTRAQALSHVKSLRKWGLIKVRKKGTVLHYSMKGQSAWMPSLLKIIGNHPDSEKQFSEDLKRFTQQLPKTIKRRRS